MEAHRCTHAVRVFVKKILVQRHNTNLKQFHFPCTIMKEVPHARQCEHLKIEAKSPVVTFIVDCTRPEHSNPQYPFFGV